MSMTLAEIIHSEEEALAYIRSKGNYFPEQFVEIRETCVTALKEKAEREDPRPLTLVELGEMDGQPVYVQYGDGREGWAVLFWECGSALLFGGDCDEDPTGEPDTDFYDLRADDPDGHFGLHILGWIAYRHKPKGPPEKKCMTCGTMDGGICTRCLFDREAGQGPTGWTPKEGDT